MAMIHQERDQQTLIQQGFTDKEFHAELMEYYRDESNSNRDTLSRMDRETLDIYTFMRNITRK
jgi:hypothetical protein